MHRIEPGSPNQTSKARVAVNGIVARTRIDRVIPIPNRIPKEVRVIPIDHVIAYATINAIVASAAHNPVIPIAPRNRVVPRTGINAIVAQPTRQGIHPYTGRNRIVPRAPIHDVRAVGGMDRIIPRIPEDRVIPSPHTIAKEIGSIPINHIIAPATINLIVASFAIDRVGNIRR